MVEHLQLHTTEFTKCTEFRVHLNSFVPSFLLFFFPSVFFSFNPPVLHYSCCNPPAPVPFFLFNRLLSLCIHFAVFVYSVCPFSSKFFSSKLLSLPIPLCWMERASGVPMSISQLKFCYMCRHVGLKRERAWGKGRANSLWELGAVDFQNGTRAE